MNLDPKRKAMQDGALRLAGWRTNGILYPNNVPTRDEQIRPFVVRYHAGAFEDEPLPIDQGSLEALSMADATHALAVGGDGLVLSFGYQAR